MNVKPFLLGAVSYLLVVFPVAYIWHLVVFKSIYDELGYFSREEPIIALGFLAITVQGLLLSYLYPFFQRGGSAVKDGLRFGFLTGIFLWSTQVVAAAAKHEIEPLPTWIAIETTYVIVQFSLVGLAMGLVHGKALRNETT